MLPGVAAVANVFPSLAVTTAGEPVQNAITATTSDQLGIQQDARDIVWWSDR